MSFRDNYRIYLCNKSAKEERAELSKRVDHLERLYDYSRRTTDSIHECLRIETDSKTRKILETQLKVHRMNRNKIYDELTQARQLLNS